MATKRRGARERLVKAELARELSRLRGNEMSQQQVADLVDASNASVSRWENPQHTDFPEPENLWKLAEMYGEDPVRFVRGWHIRRLRARAVDDVERARGTLEVRPHQTAR